MKKVRLENASASRPSSAPNVPRAMEEMEMPILLICDVVEDQELPLAKKLKIEGAMDPAEAEEGIPKVLMFSDYQISCFL